MQTSAFATAAGLTTEEARQRFLKFGANDPVSSRRTSGLTQILFLFINPLAIILAICESPLCTVEYRKTTFIYRIPLGKIPSHISYLPDSPTILDVK